MGYRNQMDTVCKALFLAALTNRSVCVGHFNSDYRTAPDIATHHFIDLTATKAYLHQPTLAKPLENIKEGNMVRPEAVV